MIASSIPTVTDAFLELLGAATWPASVPKPQISDSDPDVKGRYVVIVGDTADESGDEQSTPLLGNRTRTERYRMRLEVQALAPGLNIKEARTAAFAILSVIEDLLVEHPTLDVAATSNLQVVSVQLVQPTHRQGAIGEGQGCVIESAIDVHARLMR